MSRIARLRLPGFVFALMGLLLFAANRYSWADLRGGLIGRGVYAAVLAVVITAFLLAMTAEDTLDDDFTPKRRSSGPLRRFNAWTGLGLGTISRRPVSFRRALGSAYRRVFSVLILLGFGIGAFLITIGTGIYGDDVNTRLRSWATSDAEVLTSAVLIIGAAILVAFGGVRGCAGFVIGVAVAAVAGDNEYNPMTRFWPTVIGWAGLSAVVIAVASVRPAVRFIRHRRAATRPDRITEPGDPVGRDRLDATHRG